jgi:glycosyltransferase involved in cell wall biosynthesis
VQQGLRAKPAARGRLGASLGPAPGRHAMPLFTVFTATFNRRETLPRVFDSLRQQTSRDFEWLIVDDGSTDGTEDLIGPWREEADFPIRYIRQENRGKHVAMNRGVRDAAGDLFLPLDSDDACVPEALETLTAHWLAIPHGEREGFSGVCCHCMDANGSLVGERFGEPWFDAYPAQIASSGRVVGEKWGFQRTEVQRRFPFPEYPGEKLAPESLVWDRIGREYKLRYVDIALRIYHFSPDGLMAGLRMRAAASPNSHADYYAQRLGLPLTPLDRAKNLTNECRYSLHARRRIRIGEAHRVVSALLLPFALPLGALLYLKDRRALAAAARRQPSPRASAT